MPTIWPELLIAVAVLLVKRAPRVPRSVILPRCHRNACCDPFAVALEPTT